MKKQTSKKTAGRTGRKTKRGREGNQIRKLNLLLILAAAIGLLLFAARIFLSGQTIQMSGDPTYLSDSVLEYRDTVEFYAEKNGISEYTDYLLAIMQVESGGSGKDVMQSSESLGLAPNTLDTDESIRQGCAYLAETLGRAEALGCDTLTAVQAYNYGIDYVDFVAENGGAESIEIAEEFAKQRSGGATVNYYNGVAIKYNGGYRYRYGNMFYAELVRRLVEGKA